MTTEYTTPQIVRFDGRSRQERTYWQVCAFQPDNGELRCCWLSPQGWLAAQAGNGRRYCRFGTETAARRAIAEL